MYAGKNAHHAIVLPCVVLAMQTCAWLPGPAAAQEVWPLEGWAERAVVRITEPAPEADTAVVRILCQGLAQESANDYRVLDAAGNPVPYLVAFHDAARYSLIAFRAADPGATYRVYYGNPSAERAAERIAFPSAPGAGAPVGEWIPRQGLFFETRERPPFENPETVEELADMLAWRGKRYGARVQRRISDGFNPFGPSDMYISLYRGWIRIDQPGTYWFCTASNEASFSFLDGKELIHWPGRHTEERGSHGEKCASIELSAGLHFIEYYHEEVALQQVAFLGWRGRNHDGAFTAIPLSLYPAPHRADVTGYERPGGPAFHFEPHVLDTWWPEPPAIGQITRCRFELRAPGNGDTARIRWDFGDGLSAEGVRPEHLYVRLGLFPVVGTLEINGKTAAAGWPLEIYAVQHLTEGRGEGDIASYLALAESYDLAALDPVSLASLAGFLHQHGNPARVQEAAAKALGQIPPQDTRRTARLHRLLADAAGRQGEGQLAAAIQHYRTAADLETNAVTRIESLTRLVELHGLDRGEPVAATNALEEIHAVVETHLPTPALIAAYREALVTAGDVFLWSGMKAAAIEHYLQAEAAATEPLPLQVRAARIGSYPFAVRDHVRNREWEEALRVLDEWEKTLPVERAKGQTLYWRGRILLAREQPAEAARMLRQSLLLAEGAAFETETRWLLAAAYRKSGQEKMATQTLRALATSGLQDEYTEKAKASLAGVSP